MSEYRDLIEEHITSAAHLSKRHVHPRMAKMFDVGGMQAVFRRAQGQYLWDLEDNKYLDLLAGGGTHFIGRNHPRVREALTDALSLDLPNLSIVNSSVLGGLLAKRLLKLAGSHYGKVLFGNSGTEATDLCLRFARFLTGRRRFLYLEGAFHGRTYASISVCGFPELRAGMEPLMPICTPVRPNDLGALRRELAIGDVAGFIFEPVQGMTTEVLEPGYLREAEILCHRYGTIMIADEVQTGLGRTGSWFATGALGVRPQMIAVSKTLSGGQMPVSAVLVTDEAYEAIYAKFTSGPIYFSTFAENNLAMTAAIATLDVLEDMDAPARADELSRLFRDGLEKLREKYDSIEKINGKGLMIGIYFRDSDKFGLRLQQKLMGAAEKGAFGAAVNVDLYTRHRTIVQIPGPGLNAIKILPPVILSNDDVQYFIDALDDTLGEYYGSRAPVAAVGRGIVNEALKTVRQFVPPALVPPVLAEKKREKKKRNPHLDQS